MGPEINTTMESYIVRVYRYSPDDPHKIVGVIQSVYQSELLAFTGVDELWDSLKILRQNSLLTKNEIEE
jgi:hypothetical protein